ncbi:hypothetical protein CKK33_01920 [Mucilaginibacter sp. MD40]|uniref:RagB/SusD family nutrient uptake outer membrane protein n=1 Tax=Mucilaginibacter sp. MD40 TaxID=2029590 RepID=UPI000BACE586|nr:RagB/SusD family nutrient uptake outer membrane protein [Mucilaginibacter sp. MD40]PAW92315.1 hypothetical protein CKK33_01920 [Mucilaginibacter sp. MD40]
MFKKTTLIIASSLAFIAIAGTGCKKLVEINPPLNETSSRLAFSSDATAKSALSGLYTSLSQVPVQTYELTQYSSLQADDLNYLSANPSLVQLSTNGYTRLSTISDDPWNNWYNIIYQANSIINGLQSTSGTSPAIKKQLTAEAKFIRAYCYFNLINTFGDVPLVLETVVSKTAFLPRTDIAVIYQQIIADLTDAKADLLSDYAFTAQDRIGVNKFTAAALLARVYLFTARYAEAEANASEVLASSLYSLTPQTSIATGVFAKNSKESIWQLAPPINNTYGYTYEGSTFIPYFYSASAISYSISADLKKLFSASDLRRTKWINDVTVSGTTYSIPFKYKNNSQSAATSSGVTEYLTMMRLAEQYLIRAEARARIGSDLAGALSDLNTIRTRAGAPTTNTTVAADLLNEIATENRKELFCEQAYRWYNLKRTGQADAVLGALKTTYKPSAKLLPLPQAALDANPNLIQNPGY